MACIGCSRVGKPLCFCSSLCGVTPCLSSDTHRAPMHKQKVNSTTVNECWATVVSCKPLVGRQMHVVVRHGTAPSHGSQQHSLRLKGTAEKQACRGGRTATVYSQPLALYNIRDSDIGLPCVCVSSCKGSNSAAAVPHKHRCSLTHCTQPQHQRIKEQWLEPLACPFGPLQLHVQTAMPRKMQQAQTKLQPPCAVQDRERFWHKAITPICAAYPLPRHPAAGHPVHLLAPHLAPAWVLAHCQSRVGTWSHAGGLP